MTSGGEVAGTMSAPASSTGDPYPCFNGLRAIAALSVVVFHATTITGALTGRGSAYLLSLNVGVWVFFAISGFLLYIPFVRAHVIGSSVAVGPYFRRRFARIFPAYWVALAVTTLILGRSHLDGIGNIVMHVTLTQFYARDQLFSGLAQAWTLSVEVSFYVFLPVYSQVVSRIGRRVAVPAVELVGIATLVVVGIVSQVVVAEGSFPQWLAVLPAHIHAFAMGMLLAVLITVPVPGAVTRALGAAGRVAWLWWTLSLVSFALIHRAVGPDVINALGVDAARVACGTFAVIPAVLGGRDETPGRRFLANRVVAFLGVVSYGVYLWHPALLDLVHQDWLGDAPLTGSMVVLLLTALPLIVVVASSSWYLVERPAIRLVRRPGRRML